MNVISGFQVPDYIMSDYDDVCTKNLYKNGCDFTQSPDSDIYLQIDTYVLTRRLVVVDQSPLILTL